MHSKQSQIRLAIAASCVMHMVILGLLGMSWHTAEHGLRRPHLMMISSLSLNNVEPQIAVSTSDLPVSATSKLEPSETPDTTPLDQAQATSLETQSASELLATVQTFVPAEKLSLRPVPEKEFNFSELITKAGEAFGLMVFKLWIDATGDVMSIEVEKTEFSPEITAAATDILKRTKFVPGQLSGLHVGSILKIEIAIDEKMLLSN